MKKIWAIFLFVTSSIAYATTYNVTPASALQTVINGTASGDTVSFAAGTYNVTPPITLNCGVTYTGPTVTPAYVTAGESTTLEYAPTAILSSATTGHMIFQLSNCTTATVVQYLHFEGTGGIYAVGPINNLTVQYGAFDHLPGLGGGGQYNDEGIYLYGGQNANSIGPNINIQWNTFGDSTSCLTPSSVMNASQADQGGLCNGVMGQGQTVGFNVTNNTFFHLEEGVKTVCDGTTGGNGNPCADSAYSPAGNESPFTNIVVTNNSFDQIHRIPAEFQPGHFYTFQYNDIQEFYNPNTLTFGVSMACCVDLVPAGDVGEMTNSNVMTNDIAWTNAFNLGYEWWGNGAQANNNLIQAQFNCMICFGYGPNTNPTWEITYNTLQNNRSGAQFIGSEENVGYTPVETGNVTSTTYTTQTSAAPTISPAPGAQTYPLTVTLTDNGYGATTPLPNANTSIWYTTDGSTPVPNSGTSALCNPTGASSCTITLTSAKTVKAIGMWGTGANTVKYASAGYGFAASAATVAAYTLSSGNQYYISPSGSDSNNGTSASTPWLSPNHSLNCGDVITAASGTYSQSNFANGEWGTVSCPSSNNVAWLKCATFDTCKISSTSADAMWITNSYWGVTGWETTVTGGTNGACYHIGPSGSGIVHHVIMANDIANVCKGGGFNAYDLSTSASVDYIVYVGNIAYNAAGGTGACYSGFNVYQPIASDNNGGTHMYMAGNFAFDNVDGDPCSGGQVTDGEGLNYDTFDFDQGGGTAYTQQAVMQNNISLFNGGDGILDEYNSTGSSHSPQFMLYNTVYGNETDVNESYCGHAEIIAQNNYNITITHNLAQTAAATGCMSEAIYAMEVQNGNAGDIVNTNWFGGTHPTSQSGSTGFSFGTNVTGTSAAFANPVNPPAPSCGSFASVPACMATVIANYTASASGASAYGYQHVSNTSVVDSLFPAWLCSGTSLIAGFPSGLVTPGCGSGAAPTLTSVAVSGTSAMTLGGTTVSLTATGTYSDASTQNVTTASTWNSSNTSVCTVGTNTGVVTATGAGTCSITAADSGQTSPGFTVTVTLSLSSIAVSGTNSLIAGGSTASLTATGTYSNGSTSNITTASTWTSSNTSVCTVGTNTGVVTPLQAGTCNITAADAGKVSSAYAVTVSSATLTSLSVTGTNTLTVGQGTSQLTATGTFSNGTNSNITTASTWTSSNTSVCTVTVNGGLVTPVSGGTCNITATDSGITNSPVYGITVTAAAPPGQHIMTNITIAGKASFN
jgi:hypothetical protein